MFNVAFWLFLPLVNVYVCQGRPEPGHLTHPTPDTSIADSGDHGKTGVPSPKATTEAIGPVGHGPHVSTYRGRVGLRRVHGPTRDQDLVPCFGLWWPTSSGAGNDGEVIYDYDTEGETDEEKKLRRMKMAKYRAKQKMAQKRAAKAKAKAKARAKAKAQAQAKAQAKNKAKTKAKAKTQKN